MFKDSRYINAGQNEFYRWGHKAIDKIKSFMEPNAAGFYSMPTDGGKYYTIGTSFGKYGEYAKFGDTFLSVNTAGRVWAKVGTPKADAFLAMCNRLIDNMVEKFNEGNDTEEEEEI